MAEKTLKKVEEQLNCSICLETYKDPKFLQCLHAFCKPCLEKLVKNQKGKLSITCPDCRKVTPVPAKGVAGLQIAFRIANVLEVMKEHKKVHPIPVNCSEHNKERELFCETCENLICWKCAIKGGKHHDHDYQPLDEAFEKYKEEVIPSIKPMEEKCAAIKKAVAKLDEHCGEISHQKIKVEDNIHNTAKQIHQIVDLRKSELIDQLDQLTRGKLDDLAGQRDNMETIHARLSSCLEFVKDSVITDNREEVLKMRTNVVKQVSELAPAQKIKPVLECDFLFSVSSDSFAAFKSYGTIIAFDPLNCHALGIGKKAVVGHKSTAVINVKDDSCVDLTSSFYCELISEITGSVVKGDVKKKGQNQYEISYQPAVKGRHQLHIKIKAHHIQGSPFTVEAGLSVQKLGTPYQTIDKAEHPWGVMVNRKGSLVVTEFDKHRVTIFSPRGEKIRSFGMHGHNEGQFNHPCGVALDDEENIFIADCDNHRIQKFTADGQFLRAVGAVGSGPKQFNSPKDIAFNPTNKKLYVADTSNHRIQVLKPDLTFANPFGRKGNGRGRFSLPWAIAFNNVGEIYVTDSGHNCIQVFNTEGRFLRMFKSGDREVFEGPVGVTIDANDNVYISEDEFSSDIHRVSVFDLHGQFLTSFGRKDIGENFSPCGLTVDSSGVLYVCNSENNRIHFF